MMDKNNKYNINTAGSHDDNVVRTSDFQPFSCPTGQEIVYGGTARRTTTFECGSSSGSKSSDFNIPCNLKYQQNHPRKKKRTKLIKIDGSNNISKPKYGKRPDPTAPKIISPCSQCGKKFWSDKALFGHMRCHPEREWRGMKPPPNFTYPPPPPASVTSSILTNPENPDFEIRVSVEDHEVATCLLMLANGGRGRGRGGGPSFSESPTVTTARNVVSDPDFLVFRDPNTLMGCRWDFVDSEVVAGGGGPSCGRFECSSCKKVFGSHQALGGHRASHKNVKGCFAIHKNGTDDDDDDQEQQQDHGHHFGEIEVVNKDDDNLVAVYDHGGHKCGICLRVFSSGQALGGHKRRHWEKGEDHGRLSLCGLDLNLPPPMPLAPVDSLGVALDLRLGL